MIGAFRVGWLNYNLLIENKTILPQEAKMKRRFANDACKTP